MINNKIKIMIAEDNKDLANMLVEFIGKEKDMEVVGVTYNGRDCLDNLVSLNPDILLLDLVMPEIDGMGILRYIKENNVNVGKVIMMTAFGQEEVTRNALNFGASYFVVKPFEPNYVIQYMRDIVYQTNSVTADELEVLVANKEVDIEKEIQELVLKTGIPANIKGFVYVKEGIKMAYDNNNLAGSITKVIYPDIASKFHTTSSRVERAIRHAIEVSWNKGDNEFLKNLFAGVLDTTKTKPTNGELIFLLAERLKFKNKKDLD